MVKFGVRKPSMKKSVKARTTGKMKRKMKSSINPYYGKKGAGWVNNPKKATYNKIYNKTTLDALAPLKKKKRNASNSKNHSYGFISDVSIIGNTIPDLRQKNILIAYMLCVFLGFIGVHRMYLGVPKGNNMFKITVFSLGLGIIVTIPWAILDLFLIIRWFIESNNEYHLDEKVENQKEVLPEKDELEF